jgi:uncharacterized protein YjbJ (UPF0337 family)
MNEDVLTGKWNQLKGEIKKQWGKLTDDELDMIDGQRDKLLGKMQEKYGYARFDAERELDNFLADWTD